MTKIEQFLRDLCIRKCLVEMPSEFFFASAEIFGNSVQHQRLADLQADLLKMEADRKTAHDLKRTKEKLDLRKMQRLNISESIFIFSFLSEKVLNCFWFSESVVLR